MYSLPLKQKIARLKASGQLKAGDCIYVAPESLKEALDEGACILRTRTNNGNYMTEDSEEAFTWYFQYCYGSVLRLINNK